MENLVLIKNNIEQWQINAPHLASKKASCPCVFFNMNQKFITHLVMCQVQSLHLLHIKLPGWVEQVVWDASPPYKL